MKEIFLTTLATFWAWETLRYSAQAFIPKVFEVTRPLHPFIVLALPLYVLWPRWVDAAAVAALVGLLHQFAEARYAAQPASFGSPGARRRSRLPKIP